METQTNHKLSKKFLFASTNKGKLAEVNLIAKNLGLTVIDPSTLIEKFGPVPDVEEGIESYHTNALLKATAFFNWCGLPVISDDTGLEVFVLNNQPGIKSARYAGVSASMTDNKNLLLKNLKDFSDRSAVFKCVLCYLDSEIQNQPIFSDAILTGYISTNETIMTTGFGYDGLFLVEDRNKSLSILKEDGFLDTHRMRAFINLYSQN